MDDNSYVGLASHCIGIGHRNPYRRHGKVFYRPYRNHFASNGMNDEWEVMCGEGYAEKSSNGKYLNYSMTRAGLDWLGKQLNITIYDEED